MKLICYRKVNIRVVYKLILSFLVFVARHAQSTQNNKFAISLQYLNKKVKGEVDCLHAGKHQRFLQGHTFIFGGRGLGEHRTWGPAIIS